MRKLLFSIVALIAAVGFVGSAFAYDAPTYSEWTNLNRNNSRQGNAVRELKLVRYASREPSVDPISNGSAVVYDTVSDDGITIDVTTTSSDGAFAGIVAAGVSIPTADAAASSSASDDAGKRNWGYIVVHGPASARIQVGGANAPAVGDAFITSSDGIGVTTATGAESTLTAIGVKRLIRGKGGFFMDTDDGTSSSIDVFVMAE